ncbi:MAG TPA: hypothetical protein VJU18_13010, partial [Vicinamibacteria bacterium]|nr:hypothetical protein [Vicinamibacteria bacterium]
DADLTTLLRDDSLHAAVEFVASEDAFWVSTGCVCEGTSSRVHRVFLRSRGVDGDPLIVVDEEQENGFEWSGVTLALRWSDAGVFWAYTAEAVTLWDLEGRTNTVPLRGLVNPGDHGLDGAFIDYPEVTMWPTVLRVDSLSAVSVLTWRKGILRWIELTRERAVEKGRAIVSGVQRLAWGEGGAAWLQTDAGVLEIRPRAVPAPRGGSRPSGGPPARRPRG